MKNAHEANITRQELIENNTWRLDMAALGGRGQLEKPLKQLIMVIFHRAGVLFSVHITDRGWIVKVTGRSGRKRLPDYNAVHQTAEDAENEFLRTAALHLPLKIKMALLRTQQS